jgi:chromosome segregation ATPase
MDMSWLNMQWITTYWLPLLISLILGFILGWLLTGLSPRRRNAEYEAQLADLESKARRTERELTDARKQVDSLKSSMLTTENTLSDVRQQLNGAQADVQRLSDEKAQMENEIQSRNIESADLKMQLALLNDQFDKTRSAGLSEGDLMRGELDALNAQLAQVTADRDSIAAEYAAVRGNSETALQALSNKDAALNEAYQRAVNLQRALEDRESVEATTSAELSSLRTEVAALTNIRNELEERLQKARGDVAGEMAVLTSTMIKMKEDQLITANARIAELMNELNALKSNQAAG